MLTHREKKISNRLVKTTQFISASKCMSTCFLGTQQGATELQANSWQGTQASEESCPQELKIHIILQNIPFQVIQEDWIKAPKLKTISKSSTTCSQATLKALAAQD
ncbi:hypothetical protein Anapl_14490 [Anas platyrhynchos]|uniref:Uncharacterized protein n=1 Tax=Anas platyrhynchos TaxID=8839 RepID=R0JYF9_ANAPL|nr:hypothetical protein Anapl_14490 [Anas platyrhynchos]